MKAIFGFLLFASAVFCENVLELTDANFKNIVKDKDIILVEFFAPWCGHCKRLAPEFEKAATALLKNDPLVFLAKVDCVGEGKDTCSKYGVTGYPTLKIFRDGEPTDYDGPRDGDGIASYMKSRAGPASVELTGVDQLQKKLDDSEDVLVIGFFSDDNAFNGHFQKTADQKRSDYNFAHSINADINKQFGHENVVVLFRPKHLHAKFENPKEVLEFASSVSDIKDFIDNNSVGLVGQMVPDKEASFSKPLIVAYYQVDWKKNLKGSRYWRNRVARVAKKFVGVFTFAIASKSDYEQKIGDWGAVEEVIAAAFNVKGHVFLMKGKFSVDAFETFVNEFKDDKLEPYIKSEPLPEDNDGPVKVLVGKNFDEIVNDPTKDVLIEFYAPWCGHCKTLEPKYVELGEKLKDVKDIVIAKMDATANDVPPAFEVQGFPTIYWAPMGQKDSPKKYEGAREVDDFVEFIKKEATNPVDIKETTTEKEL